MNISLRACRALAVALIVVVESSTAARVSAAPPPLNIAVILSLTGQAAFSGQADEESVKAFERYANDHGGVRGQPIHFVISDDQTNPQVALELANRVIATHVPVILGSTVVAPCASIGAAVAASGPVEFCFSSGYSPPKDSYAFASTAAINSTSHTLLTYMKLRGFHRIAILVSTDATGIVSGQIYESLLKRPEFRDLQLVADERISNSDISATAQMAIIKAAKADVLYTSTSGTVFSTVMRSMNDVGMDIPVITTGANANLPQLKSLGDDLPHELYFAGFPFRLGNLLRDKGIRDRIDAFKEAFKSIGVTPTDSHTLGWDELLLTLAGFRQFGSGMTADQLKTFVLGQTHFAGINGYYNFSTGDQHGLGPDSVVVVGYDKQKATFFPASQLGGSPIAH